MRCSVSNTAEYGDYTQGPRVIDDLVKGEMRQILAEIQNGSFATEWISENQTSRPSFKTMKRMEAKHLMEVVGKKLRDMMPWLKGEVISRSRSILDNKRHIKSFFEVERTQRTTEHEQKRLF
jgi:ketol-acid reductoisomerase